MVEREGPSLVGRNWLGHLKIDWHAVCHMQSFTEVEELLTQHKEVFEEGLGTVVGTTVKLHLKPKALPNFCKARPMPFMLKRKVEIELQRLEAEGVISPVCFADWAMPIVPLAKRDGSVRICGDYKITLNQALVPEVYPLPKIEELLAALAGGINFSKLDLSHAVFLIRLYVAPLALAILHWPTYKQNLAPGWRSVEFISANGASAI